MSKCIVEARDIKPNSPYQVIPDGAAIIIVNNCGKCPYWRSDDVSGGKQPSCNHTHVQVIIQFTKDRRTERDSIPADIPFCPIKPVTS